MAAATAAQIEQCNSELLIFIKPDKNDTYKLTLIHLESDHFSGDHITASNKASVWPALIAIEIARNQTGWIYYNDDKIVHPNDIYSPR
ncbi:MAG: hypothetical protein U1F46_04510 [Marinagarivorans sp.]